MDDKKSNTLWIILGIVLLLSLVGGVVYYFVFSETAEKKKLVDQIIEKYSGKNGNEVLSRDKLMQLEIEKLKGILDGSIH